MPTAAELILEANDRTRVPEDRVTEVFAAAVQAEPEFAKALTLLVARSREIREALASNQCELQVATQRRTLSDYVIDCEIAWTLGARRAALVWIENKTGSGYSHNQLEKYRTEIRKGFYGGERGEILTIVPSRDAFPDGYRDATDSPWKAITWQDAAILADEVGRRWGHSEHRDPAHWRAHACSRSAPRRIVYLNEFIALLERKGLAQMEGIKAEDVAALPRGLELSDLTYRFLADVIEAMPNFKAAEMPNKNHKGWGYLVHLEFTEGGTASDLLRSSWVHDEAYARAAYPELMAVWRQHVDAELPADPAIIASLTFPPPDDESRDLLAKASDNLRDSASARNAARIYFLENGYIYYYKLLFLSEIAVSGTTLPEQTAYTARWASEAFEALYSTPLPI